MGERQAHLVFAAVVEVAAMSDAVVVSHNAADGVGGGAAAHRADGAGSDVLACRNAMGCDALGGAEGLDVVAVGGRAVPVAHEGGAGRAAISGVDADLGGGEERVADVDGLAAPTYESAATGG